MTPLAAVLATDRTTFNGFGRHTANDVCHALKLHPAMPVYDVCEDDVNWAVCAAYTSLAYISRLLSNSSMRFTSTWHPCASRRSSRTPRGQSIVTTLSTSRRTAPDTSSTTVSRFSASRRCACRQQIISAWRRGDSLIQLMLSVCPCFASHPFALIINSQCRGAIPP